MKKVVFKYNLTYSLFLIVFVVAILAYTIPKILYFYVSNQTANWGLLAGFDGLIMITLLLVSTKILIPALKNSVALELNEEGIIDNIRNNMINWSDIQSIEISSGKTSSNIILKLTFGDTYTLYLSMVNERTEVIYDEIHKYLRNKASR